MDMENNDGFEIDSIHRLREDQRSKEEIRQRSIDIFLYW